MAGGEEEEADEDAPHGRNLTLLRTHAIEGRAELAEELRVALRRKPRLHRVEVLLVEGELGAAQPGRAASTRSTARLRTVSAVRPLGGEAGEALALARAQVEVLPPGLGDELGPRRVLHMTWRSQVGARAGAEQEDCQEQDSLVGRHDEGKLVPRPAAARGCPPEG